MRSKGTPDFESIKREALAKIKAVSSRDKLQAIRVFYLGRKEGLITQILKNLSSLSLEEKRIKGPLANQLKGEVELSLQEAEERLTTSRNRKSFDMTMPGKKIRHGSLHPLTLVENKIIDIFRSLNFSVVSGPEAESEYYNFDALNIPANHPAREMWDTFWIKGGEKNKNKRRMLMRTHTSPVQIRFMENNKPPFQIVAPGRVFRYEATDASHEVNFHQIEGLVVGKTITLANLKYIITELLNQFFGKKLEFRFRPSYFPFVEPGIEVDIKMEKGGKWLEVMGAGMVHEKVLKAVKIDPSEWQGFAFGLGVERLAMLKYGIPDIRMFYGGDLRFIRQF